jgi:hypothetical protein
VPTHGLGLGCVWRWLLAADPRAPDAGIHGRNDTTVPYNGQPSAMYDGTRWWYEAVVTEAATIAVRYGCRNVATRNTTIESLADGLSPPSANLECMEFTGCSVGLRVAYVVHTPPSPSRRCLGYAA